MRNNSLLGALSSAGTMGVGERQKVPNRQEVKITSDPSAKAGKGNYSKVATHEKAASSKSVNQNVGKAPSYQSLSTSPAPETQGLSKNNQNPLIGIVILCSLVGAVGVGSLVANGVNNSSGYRSNSSYSYDVGPIPYGQARFKSGRTGRTELLRVSISSRNNVNGHKTYDVRWGDGVDATYVFWANGSAEIFSKNGNGNMERTYARFRNLPNGDCVITADGGAVTTFPNFTPISN